MDIDIIFKIAAVGIVITVINQVLSKNGRDDIATMVTIVGVIIVLIMVIDIITGFFDTVRTMFTFY